MRMSRHLWVMLTSVPGFPDTLAPVQRSMKASYKRYSRNRTEWLLAKASAKPGREAQCIDPAQIAVLVSAIKFVEEVEAAFNRVASGSPNAMQVRVVSPLQTPLCKHSACTPCASPPCIFQCPPPPPPPTQVVSLWCRGWLPGCLCLYLLFCWRGAEPCVVCLPPPPTHTTPQTSSLPSLAPPRTTTRSRMCSSQT
jgi:hypothetical protein